MNYPQSTPDLQHQLSIIQSQLQGMNTSNVPPFYLPPQAYSQMLTPVPVSNKIFRQISRVHGLQGAKEYQSKLSAGSSEIIADYDDDVLYMVMVDANGNSPEEIAVLDFQIRKQKAEQPQYITRQDFDAFMSEIRQLLKKEESNEQLA